MADVVEQEKPRILVVDDDADFIRLLHFALSRNGYHVERAANGVEGLAIADTFRPHVIVTDLMMPELDGTGFCQAIKSKPHLHPVYVIMLTAKASAESLVSNLEIGADDYVVKPAGMRTLKARIEVGLRWVEAQGRLRWLAHNDSLTSLPNRHMLDRMLEYETAKALEDHSPLSLILVDVDLLKRLNDDFGHAVGDVALRRLSDIIRDHVRATDFPARYGGDEFAIVLPGADLEAATLVAERLRQAVASDPWPALGDPLAGPGHRRTAVPSGKVLTVSVGVASFLDLKQPSLESLLRAADVAAYRAKRSGRDQVYVFDQMEGRIESREAELKVPGTSQPERCDREVLRRFQTRVVVRDETAMEALISALHAQAAGWVQCGGDGQPVARGSVGLPHGGAQNVVSALDWQPRAETSWPSCAPLSPTFVAGVDQVGPIGTSLNAVSIPSVDALGKVLGGLWVAWEASVDVQVVDWLGLRWLARLLALELEMDPFPHPSGGQGNEGVS